jgi:hypothetical protein
MAFPLTLHFGDTQSPHVRFDDVSSFFRSLRSLERHAYSLEAVTQLIGDKIQLAIDCRRVSTMSRAPVA